jgi:alpha-L-arabinofuranosidase
MTRLTTTLPITTSTPFSPSYFVAGKNEATNSYILKAAVYNSKTDVPFDVIFEGLSSGATATLTVLSAQSAEAQNSPGMPQVVQRQVTTLMAGKDGGFAFALPGLSVAVLEAKG